MENLRLSKWDEEYFNKVFKETISQYPTGASIDLNEVAQYHHSIPKHKNIPEVFLKAKNEGVTLLTPRGGVAGIDQMTSLLQYIQDEGEAMNPFPIFRKDESLDEYFKREKTSEEKQLLMDWSARSNLLEQRREKGLALFATYYIHLWD